VTESKQARALEQAWRIVGWLGVLGVIVLSLTPNPPSIGVEQGDKIGHAAAYAALMLWFAQLHLQRWQRVPVALWLLALGIALEFAQGWTGPRTLSIADMGADAAGIALGWFAAPPRGPNLLANVGRMVADLS
jgi:VanZ family protein